MRSIRAAMLAGVVALTLGSCAGMTPDPTTMPAARAGLLPEYRLFFDSLEDYGDWVLIEPLGYVFRPSVNFVAFRPYMDGFWAPSDLYGWVWISAEPFGWATYHYGRWTYDRFQGWVWIPGVDWAPAWVDWTDAGDYVGWAPRLAAGATRSDVPGGITTYAPTSKLGSTDIQAHARAATASPGREPATAVDNPGHLAGVTFNRGPSMARIERVTGPLTRVRIEDVVPGIERRDLPPASAPGSGGPEFPLSIETTRAAADAARQARELKTQPSRVPSLVPIVRPIGGVAPPADEFGARRFRPAAPAAADSAK